MADTDSHLYLNGLLTFYIFGDIFFAPSIKYNLKQLRFVFATPVTNPSKNAHQKAFWHN